jgi:thermitase
MSEKPDPKPHDPATARPCCDPGPLHQGCTGPEPTPWLSWKHCFKVIEFRETWVPQAKSRRQFERLRIRVRFEHVFCPMGRRQGPIVHSLTLLPQEHLKIYEYDRFRRVTSVEDRFSQRTSFFKYIGVVNDMLLSNKSESGSSFSVSAKGSGSGGGTLNLGVITVGTKTDTSVGSSGSGYIELESVAESFTHVAETSSQAVESERSIVVSSFAEQESGDSSFRTLRNDNQCHAVTYFIRRVYEVYCLTTRVAGIQIAAGDQWIELDAAAPESKADVAGWLDKLSIGQTAKSSTEIALPTDGLLYEAELAHCGSCEPARERRIQLELRRLELEIERMEQENDRRKRRLASGDLSPFEPSCPEATVVAAPAV